MIIIEVDARPVSADKPLAILLRSKTWLNGNLKINGNRTKPTTPATTPYITMRKAYSQKERIPRASRNRTRAHTRSSMNPGCHSTERSFSITDSILSSRWQISHVCTCFSNSSFSRSVNKPRR